MAQSKIHSFYRTWFTVVDPLSLIPTVSGILFTPEFMMDALLPGATPNPDHAFLLHQLAAMYAFMAIVLAGVLRATSDIKVWRVVIAGVLLVDISILVSMYVSLEHQGRLGLENWRWQDWGNLLFTGGVALIRSFFLLGVGVQTGLNDKKTA